MSTKQQLGSAETQTRVAVVAGLRTPFLKQSTAFRDLSALDLGKLVVSELLERNRIRPRDIQQVVYGQVIPSLAAPNIAREVVLGTGMPREVEAFSVARACATSYQSVVSVTEAMVSGSVDCAIAGGADSASDIPMTVSKALSTALMKMSKAKTFPERVEALKGIALGDLMPIAPALKELTTGLTMGQSAEKMAKDNGIPREAQDQFAHRSHQLAAKAWESGLFRDQVMSVFVPPDYGVCVAEDNIVRRDSKLESYAKLRPAFDPEYGTVTAGTSSPLTDGASAVIMMREDRAKALGLEVLGYVRSYAFCGVDPADQLLIGPAYALPTALDRAGITLRDLDLLDIHEAFAAQVLSVTQALESQRFAEQKLGRTKPVGTVDWDKTNVQGGSIAIGHPFAATGTRQVVQVLKETKRRGGNLAACTACAAGGIGAAIVLEVA